MLKINGKKLREKLEVEKEMTEQVEEGEKQKVEQSFSSERSD